MLGYSKIGGAGRKSPQTTDQSGWPGPFEHMGRLQRIYLFTGGLHLHTQWQFHSYSFSVRFCHRARKNHFASTSTLSRHWKPLLAGQVCLIPYSYFEICCSVVVALQSNLQFHFPAFAHWSCERFELIRTRWERRAERPLWKSTLQNRRVPIRSFPNSPSTVCFLLRCALVFHSALFLSPTKWKIIQHLTVNFGDWFN